MRSLENSAADYGCLVSDVYSYQKEVEFEGEVHNGVLVVQNFFNCGYPTGLGIIQDLANSRMRQFQHIAEHELPVLCDDFGLGKAARQCLDHYVRELQDWMAAVLTWHRGCNRYQESELRYKVGGASRIGAPTGLGTSAARFAFTELARTAP